MTPKQVLLEHIEAMHAKLPARRWTYADLQHWHGAQHFRWTTNHYHEGVNLGPGQRPVGWYDGSGAVLNK